MNRELTKLVLYKPVSDGILSQMEDVMEAMEQEKDAGQARELFHNQIRSMLSLALDNGLHRGNLWHHTIAYYLLTDENPFTLNRERRKDAQDTLRILAQHDAEVFYRLFHYDFTKLQGWLDSHAMDVLLDYTDGIVSTEKDSVIYELSTALESAGTAEEFYRVLTDCYEKNGTGIFALSGKFRVDTAAKEPRVFPAKARNDMDLDDLVGYEYQKQVIRGNVQGFLDGKPANNMLLYGDSGSGKSTCIRGIAKEFAPQGLRLIEMNKYQFTSLTEVLATIRDRNYKFVLFLDDLSFEEFEIEYKYLKAVIEGGAEARPENVLICATSNRRHLIKETWNDRSDMTHKEDLHHSDTMEEKLSLASRFGLQVHFPSPNHAEYHAIVRHLMEMAGLPIEDEEKLMKEADAWEIRHGGRSGRTAQQFVMELACHR